MEVRLNHNPRNPISAVVHEKVGTYLTLDFEQQNGNSISLFLPPHMAAATHLIADLFNSHIGRNQIAAMAVQSVSEGQAVVAIPSGAAMPPEGAIAIIAAIGGVDGQVVGGLAEQLGDNISAIYELPRYKLGDVNTRGQILVRINDEATSWLDRGKAWVTAGQADAARPYGWETFMVAPDCTTDGAGVVGISRR